MAVTVNESTVAGDAFAPGVTRQRLLTASRVAGTKVFLDRLTLVAGASAPMQVRSDALAWFQMLEGDATLRHHEGENQLTRTHIALLPPSFVGTLSTAAGATLLYAEVPEAGRLDAAFDEQPPQLRIIDWTREPVLDSKHDARKRIYVATPSLCGTRAIKGEIIIYPPGTQAANHHHEGAEHFMYVLNGAGTAHANEHPIRVRKGDLIYYEARERHYLRSESAEDMVFVEFFVPGTYRTVWAEGAPICTWTPTGRNIRGETPVREIRGHSSAAAVPNDV